MLMSNTEIRNLIMSIRIRIGKNGAEARKWYGSDTPMYHAYEAYFPEYSKAV